MKQRSTIERRTPYGLSVRLELSCETARQIVTESLKTEGFGVLTEIDVQDVLKEKLGVNIAPYIILGACNPALAHAALAADPNVGLLLPCNVILRQEGHECVVSFLDPLVIANVSRNDKVKEVAALAKERVERVIEGLTDQYIE
jgi:uncharacterized protein (DUF302 family)